MSSRDENALVIIDPVHGNSVPSVHPGNSLIPLIEALNPLGIIGKTVVEIMAYRRETKRLEVERERVRAQSQAISTYIQSQLTAQMRDLENRRQAILVAVQHAEVIQYERRPTREALSRSLDRAMREMSNLTRRRNIPPGALEVYKDTVSFITKAMVDLEEISANQVSEFNKELRQIVNSVRHELEGMPPIQRLSSPK